MNASAYWLQELETWLRKTFPDGDCEVQILARAGGESYLMLMLDLGYPDKHSVAVPILNAKDGYALVEYFRKGVLELLRITGRK